MAGNKYNQSNSTLSRRQFLGVLASPFATAFAGSLASSVWMPVLAESSTVVQRRNHKRIVLIELAGANDGLNTVIPHSDERYYELRPNLGLGKSDLISLDTGFSFNKSFARAMPLWESGELATVHGLGYPAPNRSHFKSIALWESGGDGVRQQRDGWMTHAVEHAYGSNSVDAHGISFGGGMNIFSSDSGNWLSLNTSRQLSAQQQLMSQSQQAGASAALELVKQRSSLLQSSLDRFRGKLENNKHRSRIPGGKLAKQLNHVVNLVNAGVDAPVYKVSLGGFDTHENQIGRHAQLLKELAGALSGFRKELVASDEWDNTLVMTYSEFGRRARENLSGGTDHGTAAPHFVAGGRVNGGFFGTSPDLGELEDDDLKFTMDYRSVYAEILGTWLQMPENKFYVHADDRLKNLLDPTG